MSPAPITEQDLHGYVDGALDGERRAAVESWLAAHPEQYARLDAWRAQNAALHRAFDATLAEAVPARLVEAAAARPLPWLRMAAVLAWIGIGAVIGFVTRGALPAKPQDIAGTSLTRQAAIAHVVYAPEVRHPVEVGADQEAHLVAWLSKRLDAPVKAPRLADAGFDLVGGRLLPGETGPVAQFMYQSGTGQRLTLYLRRDAKAAAGTGFRYAQEGAVGVFYWIEDGFGYALSGELERGDLLKVADSVYRQIHP